MSHNLCRWHHGTHNMASPGFEYSRNQGRVFSRKWHGLIRCLHDDCNLGKFKHFAFRRIIGLQTAMSRTVRSPRKGSCETPHGVVLRELIDSAFLWCVCCFHPSWYLQESQCSALPWISAVENEKICSLGRGSTCISRNMGRGSVPATKPNYLVLDQKGHKDGGHSKAGAETSSSNKMEAVPHAVPREFLPRSR
jgi:hypothetical protein